MAKRFFGTPRIPPTFLRNIFERSDRNGVSLRLYYTLITNSNSFGADGLPAMGSFRRGPGAGRLEGSLQKT
jgi:hypothetical protein